MRSTNDGPSFRSGLNSTGLLPNGFIHMTLSGDLDAASLNEVLSHVNQYIDGLSKQGFPTYLLVDVTKLQAIQLDARKSGVEWLRNAQYDKVSVYGDSMFMKYFISMLVKVIDCEMRYFNSRQDAEGWLNE